MTANTTPTTKPYEQSWRPWFAWYPVTMTHDRQGYIRVANVQPHARTAWLRWIERSDHPGYIAQPAFRDPTEPTTMDAHHRLI